MTSRQNVPWESVCLGLAVVNQLNVRLCDYAQSTYLWWPIDHHLCDSLLLSALSPSQSVCVYRSQKQTDT